MFISLNERYFISLEESRHGTGERLIVIFAEDRVDEKTFLIRRT